MNLKKILNKYKISIILPIAPIIFEIIVFTVLGSQLVWEHEDYHFGSIYTGPYYGIATLDLPESPTDKYLFIFELNSAASSYDYFYLDLYVTNLANNDTFNYSLSIQGISDSAILDIPPGREGFVWETNAHMSKLHLHTLSILNQEGNPVSFREVGIKMVGGALIFASFAASIILLIVKKITSRD